ncbi:putative response regulatory protein [compost metagenome]
MSKYHFLRSFTRSMGITPYCYLQAVRIGRAKQLLEQGLSPADTAQQTGFGDQSHFTHTFKKLIGLTPGQYARIFSCGPARQPVLQGGRHD